MTKIIPGLCLLTLLLGVLGAGAKQSEKEHAYQYEWPEMDIRIPRASSDEPKLGEFNPKVAADYIDQGARIWTGTKKCVSCHTNGTYMLMRPRLTPYLGAPPAETRQFSVDQLQTLQSTPRRKFARGVGAAQSVWIAASLAEWDHHVTKALSPETEKSLSFMLDLQRPIGTWASPDCWPPFESSAYQVATVAATALGTAPGWLESLRAPDLLARVDQLKRYLRNTPPPHDYGRVLLLWASTRLSGFLNPDEAREIRDLIWSRQRSDGGWSIRSFAEPEQWGRGNRGGKLRGEPEFSDPPSDGHMTGLAILVLRDSGVPAGDVGIQRAVQWLLSNQRQSGRWWTRSLNTDTYHFITFSATCYGLLALAKCNALEDEKGGRAASVSGENAGS